MTMNQNIFNNVDLSLLNFKRTFAVFGTFVNLRKFKCLYPEETKPESLTTFSSFLADTYFKHFIRYQKCCMCLN